MFEGCFVLERKLPLLIIFVLVENPKAELVTFAAAWLAAPSDVLWPERHYSLHSPLTCCCQKVTWCFSHTPHEVMEENHPYREVSVIHELCVTNWALSLQLFLASILGAGRKWGRLNLLDLLNQHVSAVCCCVIVQLSVRAWAHRRRLRSASMLSTMSAYLCRPGQRGSAAPAHLSVRVPAK